MSAQQQHPIEKSTGRSLILPGLRARILVAFSLLITPAVLFCLILLRSVINIPFDDDYEALLDFLNRFIELKGGAAKVSWFLSSQFNEYKLFFGHAVALLQFSFCGHVSIRSLCVIGDSFVLLLALLLWRMFLPKHNDLGDRLFLFIPASWMLFQLQYVETLNWAMPSLQNVPVLLFSFGAVHFLSREDRCSFWFAIVCLILAVASSGNGFLLVPVGILLLINSRASGYRYACVVGWLTVSATCLAAYAYHYDVLSSQSRMHESVLSTVMHPRLFYVVAFIGSSGSYPFQGRGHHLEVSLSVMTGFLLSVFTIVLYRRGYARRNPAVSYCALFIFLTAIGVAGLRSDFGIEQSLASRYSIYSTLLLIFAWFAFVEEFVVEREELLAFNKACIVATVAGAILFAFVMDHRGWLFLEGRNHEIITGIIAYEQSGSRIGPIVPFKGQGLRFDELDKHAPQVLRESIRLGVYEPPAYATSRDQP